MFCCFLFLLLTAIDRKSVISSKMSRFSRSSAIFTVNEGAVVHPASNKRFAHCFPNLKNARETHFFVTTGTDGSCVVAVMVVLLQARQEYANQMGNGKLIYFRIRLFNLTGLCVCFCFMDDDVVVDSHCSPFTMYHNKKMVI